MKHIFLVFMILCSNFAIAEDKAIAAIFSAEGVDGTIILKSLRGDKTITHNDARASRRFASASTFKIFNTLIAVQENVVSVAGTAFRWDGKTHDFPDWNRDQTLESAFKFSCVWCYQEIAKQVGEETYRRYLTLARYGVLTNVADTTTFWLDGSFTVSAVEQIALLEKIYLRELPFRDEAYDALKQVMLAEQTDSYKLYAKTGWAARMNPKIGWYVGYVETSDDVWFFAINLTLRSELDLGLRQKITKAALRAERIIP